MALITCNECGKEISSRAKACPQCGLPLKFEAGCGTYLLIFLFGIVFLYSSCKEMIKSQYNILWEERFIKQRQKLSKQLGVFRSFLGPAKNVLGLYTIFHLVLKQIRILAFVQLALLEKFYYLLQVLYTLRQICIISLFPDFKL